MSDLNGVEFVILDVETTGLSPLSGDRIVEIGLIKLKDSKITECFETLIDPRREISYSAFLVNGISMKMLEGAPPMENVLPDVLNFIKGACLVGHNIKFDLKFLDYESSLAGHDLLDTVLTIDTARMARALLPNLESYALGNLAHFLEINISTRHRAMADAELTLKVFKKLLDIARAKNICHLKILSYLFGIKKPSLEENRSKIQFIKEALSEKYLLNLMYFGNASGLTERCVKPLQLTGRGRQATLTAFCHLRNQERDFKVERILNLGKI